MARYTLLWVALFIYGIDWDYHRELIVYDYGEYQEQLKPDENYPLTAVYYSEDESKFQTYEKMVNHSYQLFDLYPDR